MKILYAIQGTGNGHLARATEIIPELKKIGETHILVSGIQSDISLPFRIDYNFYGLSFINGKKGGVDFFRTLLKLKLCRLFYNILSLPINNYDIVISDFEPVSAWACLLNGKKCIGLSHQNSVLHPLAPQPLKKDLFGKFILKYYAYTPIKYGFHFSSLDENNFTPIIRSGVRKAQAQKQAYYTVYLPAYSDNEIEKILSQFTHIKWDIFSKTCKVHYQKENLTFYPISIEAFTKSFVNCKGILTTAGYETPSEAIFMGKKLCVVPTINQYEQACNAEFLKQMGICVIYKFEAQQNEFMEWVKSESTLKMEFENQTERIIRKLITNYYLESKMPACNWIPNQILNTLQIKAISIKENKLITVNTSLQSNLKRIFNLKN